MRPWQVIRRAWTCTRSKPSWWPNRWVLIYNNLIVFDPHNYPQIIGDLAKSWTVSDDYLTYTFTLHEGVKFHDGSELTSADVKASWDRIVFPPEGVVSPRRSNYPMIKSIEAPDALDRGLPPAPPIAVVPDAVWPTRPTLSMPKNISIRMSTTIKTRPSAPGPSS